MKYFVALCLIASLSIQVNAKNWVVLTAGSKGYSNYRHQADTCHAYHVMIEGGIDPENIIVFSYNDAADYIKNPFPGQLFNKPTKLGTAGRDVYEGCKIDYNLTDVTVDNWENVLLGNADKVKGGSGRVLESTEEDKVFLNFVDHGGVGIIAFPHEMYHKKQLWALLEKMNDQQQYKELVFYLETCESGSMFVDYPTNMSIFTTTAANAKESSWGTYCPPTDIVNGKHLKTCLGDLYSVNWMEDTEAEDHRSTETLQQQYEMVKKLTNKSHVSEWGDLTISNEPIGNFIGLKSNPPVQDKTVEEIVGFHIDSRDIKLHYLMNLYISDPTIENYLNLKEEEISREYFDNKFMKLAVELIDSADEENIEEIFEISVPLTEDDCHISAIKKFESSCRQFSEYGLKYLKFLCTVCESGLQSDIINQKIDDVCR